MFSILLLDDEPHVLSSLRRALRQPLGETVSMHAFTDPYEALNHLDEQPVDLVLTDFRMPRMSGIQFLHFARGLQPNAERMIASASTDVNALISAVNEVGVFRYVVKPWTTSVLIDDVRDALSQVAAQREQRRLEGLEPSPNRGQWGPNGEVPVQALVHRVH